MYRLVHVCSGTAKPFIVRIKTLSAVLYAFLMLQRLAFDLRRMDTTENSCMLTARVAMEAACADVKCYSVCVRRCAGHGNAK